MPALRFRSVRKYQCGGDPQSPFPVKKQPQAQQRKTEVPLEVSEQEKERVENVTVEQSNEES